MLAIIIIVNNGKPDHNSLHPWTMEHKSCGQHKWSVKWPKGHDGVTTKQPACLTLAPLQKA